MSDDKRGELKAAQNMDWQQVVMNGGPPCFHVADDGRFCGRTERWDGHGMSGFHAYVSLADLLTNTRPTDDSAVVEAARAYVQYASFENCKHLRNEIIRYDAAHDDRQQAPAALTLTASNISWLQRLGQTLHDEGFYTKAIALWKMVGDEPAAPVESSCDGCANDETGADPCYGCKRNPYAGHYDNYRPAAPVEDEAHCVGEQTGCTEGYDAAMCADKACFVAVGDEARNE